MLASSLFKIENRKTRRLWLLLAVMGLALGLRLVFAAQWLATPFGAAPYLDAAAYDAVAQKILGGAGLGERAFYQSPLYSCFLALIYGAAGRSLAAVAIINAFMGAATCGLLAHAAARLFGLRAALLTGLLAALYSPFIFYTGPVMKETLALLLLALFLGAMLSALESNKVTAGLLSGIWLGLAILARGNAALLLPVFPVLALVKWRGVAVKTCALYALGTLLVILPVTLHNYGASRDFVPVNYSGGFNFYIGNRAGANGANSYPADIPTGLLEETATTHIAAQALGHPPKPSEVSAYWFGRGLDAVRNDPSRAAELTLRKAGLFFSDTEFPDNYNQPFFTRHMDTLLRLPLPGFAVALGLVAFAWTVAGRAQRARMTPVVVLALVYLCSVLPFYVTDRYRLPVMIFLLPLAGAAAMVDFGKIRKLAAGLCLALACTATSLSFPPASAATTAIGWLGLADFQLKRKNDAAALDALYQAIAASPRDVSAFMYVQGAHAQDRLGRPEKARQLFEAALRLHPDEEKQIRRHYPAVGP